MPKTRPASQTAATRKRTKTSVSKPDISDDDTSPSTSASVEAMDATTSSRETSHTPPAKREKECYKSGKGYVLYISNFVKGDKARAGVEIDKRNIKTFFESELDYELDVHEDVRTRVELWEIIRKAKEKAEADKYMSFFLIISSHGKGINLKNSGKVDDADNPIVAEAIQLLNETVRVDEIVSKCNKFMPGKPKVLIIQASRKLPDDFNFKQIYYSPTCPIDDVFLLVDTLQAIYKGAWMFHHMFVEVKDLYKTEHLLDVLTRVNELSISTTSPYSRPTSLMLSFTSSLTKYFYLKKT